MRANKIKIEYLDELLFCINKEQLERCPVCKGTFNELKEWVRKEMKREGWR